MKTTPRHTRRDRPDVPDVSVHSRGRHPERDERTRAPYEKPSKRKNPFPEGPHGKKSKRGHKPKDEAQEVDARPFRSSQHPHSTPFNRHRLNVRSEQPDCSIPCLRCFRNLPFDPSIKCSGPAPGGCSRCKHKKKSLRGCVPIPEEFHNEALEALEKMGANATGWKGLIRNINMATRNNNNNNNNDDACAPITSPGRNVPTPVSFASTVESTHEAPIADSPPHPQRREAPSGNLAHSGDEHDLPRPAASHNVNTNLQDTPRGASSSNRRDPSSSIDNSLGSHSRFCSDRFIANLTYRVASLVESAIMVHIAIERYEESLDSVEPDILLRSCLDD